LEASPTPARSLPPSTVFTSWKAIEMPIAVKGIYGGNIPDDVVVFNDRLIAVGGVNGGCCDGGFSRQTQALVWTSRDGAEWRLAPDSAVFDLGHMRAVAATEADIVVVGTLNLKSVEFPGSADPTPAVWNSDDGQHWSVLRDVPRFVDIAAGPAGFIAAAQTDEGAEVWTSASGRAWHRTAGPAELGPGGALRLVAAGAGFLLLGTDPAMERAIVWRSEDGATWDRAPNQEALDGAWLEDGAAIGGRLVVVGRNDEAPPMAWTSEDGMTWQAAGDVFGVESGVLAEAIVVNGTLLVTGFDDGAADAKPASMAFWTSNDGVSWQVVPHRPRGSGRIHEINDWVVFGDGVVAVGRADPRQAGEIVGPGAWLIR
jgi:hypothetical protein